jgi:hypothetical protein
MEYDRAVERGIPRLIFLMGDDHLIRPGDVDKGAAGAKLDALRERLRKEQVVNFFSSSADLRADVINSLAELRRRLEAEAARTPAAAGEAIRELSSIHHVSDIPAAPEPYVAHPYTLLQTRGLIGRKEELNFLTDWLAKPEKLDNARVVCVVALGGVGKSALTWNFFHSVLPHEMNPLAGRIWWSFYESDAHFDNFLIRALSYVSGQSPEEITRKLAPFERESELLAHLAARAFFIVLDGLERILVAYARMDAAHLPDDDYDQKTANFVTGARGVPEGAEPAFVGRERLRVTADLRAGQFLRKLAALPPNGSRLLISTRLYPADLQLPNRTERPGCKALFLHGLCDHDGLELWRTHGAGGSRETLIPLFNRFGNHPLLIQALAGEVAANHGKPGDFDDWRAKRRDFQPFQFEHLVQVKSHILEHSLRGLNGAHLQVLHTLAAFRMPTTYDTLVSLLVQRQQVQRATRRSNPLYRPAEPLSAMSLILDKIGELWPGRQTLQSKESHVGQTATKIFKDQASLDRALTALGDRGLLGWDQRPGVNRYDLHPIVRGVVWSGLDRKSRTEVYSSLHEHFAAIPGDELARVDTIDDLAPAIELYYVLIGLERYLDAYSFFLDRLLRPLQDRLNASRQIVEMLELLIPDEGLALPRLPKPEQRMQALSTIALAYGRGGKPATAAGFFRLAFYEIPWEIAKRVSTYDISVMNTLLVNAHILCISGQIRLAEIAAMTALLRARLEHSETSEVACLTLLGFVLGVRGDARHALLLRRISQIASSPNLKNTLAAENSAALSAQLMLWQGDAKKASSEAERAWVLATNRGKEMDLICSARLQGTAAARLNDLVTAGERLHHALSRARACNLVEEELPALIALADLHRQRGEQVRARELLDGVWEAAERGPYPLFHADARNVLAQVERESGNRDASVEAALEAYREAWCDGPPFAYHSALKVAKEQLAAFGASEPELPPFDQSKFEQMPEVEIIPPENTFNT